MTISRGRATGAASQKQIHLCVYTHTPQSVEEKKILHNASRSSSIVQRLLAKTVSSQHRWNSSEWFCTLSHAHGLKMVPFSLVWATQNKMYHFQHQLQKVFLVHERSDFKCFTHCLGNVSIWHSHTHTELAAGVTLHSPPRGNFGKV